MSDEQRVVEILARAEKVTVLTGAGINTGNDVPDFRGPNGLWAMDPASARLFTLRDYVSDPEIRREAWRIRRQHAAWTARPNAAHYALVDLENAGKLRAIVTQNIDGLHQLAGNSEDLVIEVNGSLYEVECLSCGARSAMSDTLERVEAGEDDPACLRCGGILKAGTTSFGQPIAPALLDAARAAAADCDVFLTAGASLTVRSVGALIDAALGRRAHLVVVHPESTPYDGRALARVAGPVATVLPRIVAEATGNDQRAAPAS